MKRAWMIAAWLLGCVDEELRVTAQTAADFAIPRGAKVSIFGVYKDGRVSDAPWLAIETKIAEGLREPSCELGYGARLRETEPDVAAAVDGAIRENGIDDDVLGRVAPGAEGDLVLVLMVDQAAPSPHPAQAAAPRPVMMGPGMGRRGRMGPSAQPVSSESSRLYEITGSFYSVTAHRLVAEIDARYTGDNPDEALAAFVQKLHVVAPDARCVGWTWNADSAGAAPVDAR